MNVHEYQGKEILRRYGVATPRGFPCFSVAEADAAARELGGKVWVVKAQIHAGGRGKGGGVKVAKSLAEVHEFASKILGMTLVTHQTGPGGRLVKRLLVEEGADIRKELYVGMVVDRATQRVTLMASSEGGMEIEEVAAHAPEKIHKVAIDPAAGLTQPQAEAVARKIGVPDASVAEGGKFMLGLYKAFVECDASLAEINPLILTGDGKALALDAKLNFDSNALFRHPDIVAMRDLDEEDPAEVEASKFDLSYISLDGNIGCLVNGAGLAMATMDTIKLYGAEPANFLDVGGGATTHIEEVRRLGAVELDGVHGRHREPRAINETADVAIERDVRKIELGSFDFGGILLVEVAHGDDIRMAEQRVGIEIELGVEGKRFAVAGENEGVDFRQRRIALVEGVIQTLHELARLRDRGLRHTDLASDVVRLRMGKTGRGIDG